MPLPDDASFAEGASFLLTFLTAYIPLTRQVRARGRARRCSCTRRPAASARRRSRSRARSARAWSRRSARRRSSTLCRELGAEEAYVYDEIPDDLRVDVVVDPVGGELFDAAVRAAAAARPARRDRLRGRAVAGDRAGAARRAGTSASQGFYLGRLLRLAPERRRRARSASCSSSGRPGAFRPLVGAEFPLDEVERAHELVESRRSVGKVVLVP